jgi:predicted TIM-barrel fold metal-dependent hydrolase
MADRLDVATTTRARELRESFGHPVIDGDGHMIDLLPVLLEFLDEVGGSELVDRFTSHRVYKTVIGLEAVRATPEERRRDWRAFDAWWAGTANTLDRATSMLPGLLEERMGELGFDYTVLFPSEASIVGMLPEDDLRQAGCRAHNLMVAELLEKHGHVMTPVAVIPMVTPAEAVAELHFVVRELGLKVVNLGGSVTRPVPRFEEELPDAAAHITRPELFGIDSDHDYDVVWAACRELGVAPCFHGKAKTRSISSYVYNHLGAFAAGNEAICKALFLGGVTRRFPEVNFGFMEGGVGWACTLFADLISHWEKRGAATIELLDPTRIDVDELLSLVAHYGEDRQRQGIEQIERYLRMPTARPQRLDDFAACGIERREDFYDLFVPPFFFGCEADSPINAWAYADRINPFGARLQAMLGSDIGHWDVPDMRGVLEEVYELVEHGLMSADDLRSFTFESSVRFHGRMNPAFFDGTTVEAEARAVLTRESGRTS